MQVTNLQARRFLLKKQGLWGPYRFRGKQGALAYIRQAGCIQFDPIDVCGKNPELALQSRVAGFRKEMLSSLLYKDRLLLDYFDKNLSIFPAEDWKCFGRTRDAFRRRLRSGEEIAEVEEEVLRLVREKGAVCSRELSFDRKVDWAWASTRLSRAALESLYFRGVLAIHHKEGTVKYYADFRECFPEEIWNAPEPFAREEDYFSWRVKRRIGAVGFLWDRPSDAFLGIDGLPPYLLFFPLGSPGRNCAFGGRGIVKACVLPAGGPGAVGRSAAGQNPHRISGSAGLHAVGPESHPGAVWV